MDGSPGGRRVVVAGASGLIGGALCARLVERGDSVVRLVRRPPAGPGEVRWDPSTRRLDPHVLEGTAAVVNLAGAGVGDRRWTPSYKTEILTSRTDTTHAVAAAVAQSGAPVRLVNASAVGFYGSRGDEELTEDSGIGDGFLAEVVRAWEASTAPAVDAGASVALARTGLVLAASGGAAGRLLTVARLGVGGPLGRGRQWWPWITLQDEVRALLHLLDGDLRGPVNLTGPEPARQKDVARALGRALGRPAVLPAPSLALRAVLGEFAGEILASQRVLPQRLLADGFLFEQPTLEAAVEWLLADARRAP
ncbi:MAG TPA: TIGR01777 family oxidoreductase [Dermatophilaceae bacterium]|nr:TIGR01777 family oxidoreductase [Dermatophilaceae bacterium]